MLFSSQAYVPQILTVSGVSGWLLHFSHWQKEAVWMGEIVSFVAYMVTGGQRCEESWHSQWYQEDRAPHSSLTLLNRERMCERDGGKSVKQTERKRARVKGKKRNYVKEAAVQRKRNAQVPGREMKCCHM